MYITVLKARPYYGCAFFPVSQGFSDVLPKYLTVGISGKGVFLLQTSNKVTGTQTEPVEVFPFSIDYYCLVSRLKLRLFPSPALLAGDSSPGNHSMWS